MESTILKILVVGESRSGKTSICKRLSENRFVKYIPTIGVDFSKKVIQYKENQFTIQLWDQAHNDRFNLLPRMYYRKAKGFLFVLNPAQRSSIEQIKNENEYIMRDDEIKNQVKYLIESKSDLCEKREVSKEEAIALSKENGFKYFQCSAKTGDNVSEIIHCIMRDIIERDLLSINNKKYLIDHNRHKKCIIF